LTNFGDILNFPSNFLGSYRISFTFPSKFISFILQKFPFEISFQKEISFKVEALDESNCYLQLPLMPHECGTSKTMPERSNCKQ
jgi:hypothetical protein